MPYKEGRKWRGVVTINGKRIARRLFLSKKEAISWDIEEKKRLQSQTLMVFLHEAGTAYLDYCQARFLTIFCKGDQCGEMGV